MTQPALIGRASEAALVVACCEAALAGEARTVVVSGEPGIGKTRLLAELCAEAERGGALVLTGRATEVEFELPFGLLVDALEPHLASLGPERLRALGESGLEPLGSVLPSLREAGDGVSRGLEERHLTYRATRQLLERLGDEQPLALVLDDVQWADPASIELISYLVRRPPTAPVLLAIGHRSGQLAPLLAGALGAGARDGQLQGVELGPLGRGDAVALVGADLAGAVVDDLYRQSGGNPFYLEELARASRRGGGGQRGSAARFGSEAAPAAVVAALLGEFETLSPAGRLVLEAAAVIGEPFDPALAAAAAQLDEGEVLDALDELLDAGLVRQTDVPRNFRFRHPVVRRVVYESTRGGWRLGVHARAAAELARQDAAATTRAHHLEQSAQRGDELAIADLCEAGEAAQAQAPATAARWFAAALRLLPERAQGARLVILGPLAAALRSAGRLEEARSTLLEILALLPDEEVSRRVEIVAECAGIEGWLGRHEEAQARLEAELAALPDPASHDGLELTIELAISSIHQQRFDAVRRYGQRAVDAGTALEEPVLVGEAAAVLALGEAAVGRMEEARVNRELAVERLDQVDDAALTKRLDALYYLGWAEIYACRFADARRHFARGIDVSRASGQDRLIVPLLIGQADTYLLPGEIAGATALAESTADAARVSPNPQDLIWALWQRAWTALFAGDHELAVASGEESYELSTYVPTHLFFIGDVGWTYGLALVESGEAARGIELMLEAIGSEDMAHVVPYDRCWACDDLARAELERGGLEQAGVWADQAGRIAAELDADWPRIHAHRARARVLLAQGEHAEAAEQALASAEAARRCECRVDAARSQALGGRALAAAGELERATAELRAAEAELAECGAEGWRAEAASDLRRLGHRVTRKSAPGTGEGTGLDTLTGRELEVAELVTDRRTNREIAATLFLSEKTVETHLRNIFVKLRVSSRVAVARVVEAQRQS